MKIGSVAFFKKLIVAGFATLVVLPLALAVVFGVLLAVEKGRTEQLEAALPTAEELQPPALSTQAPGQPDGVEVTSPQLEPRPNQDVLGPSFEYQLQYPELYATRPAVVPAEGKTCYLSFDDGPSLVTTRILDTLKEEDVKATFFVTGKNSLDHPEILKRAVEEGHTVAIHSYSHDYETIYASVDAFLADFDQMRNTIAETTGVAPDIFRFAGGSINNYNMYVYDAIVAEMLRRGFTFFDWNAAASDAISGGISSMEITSNVLNSAAGRERALVLMHDRADNSSTASALAGVIRGLREQGFSFAPLSAEVQPVTFYYQYP